MHTQNNILNHLKDAQSPVCKCSRLLLLSYNQSNGSVGNIVYTDSICNRYKTSNNSIPVFLIAKLHCLCFPASCATHGALTGSTYTYQSMPYSRAMQHNLLVTIEILAKEIFSKFVCHGKTKKKAQARIYARCLMPIMSSAFLSIPQASCSHYFPQRPKALT